MDYVIISTIEFEGTSRINDIFLKGCCTNVGSHWFYFRHSIYEIDKTIEEYYVQYVSLTASQLILSSLEGAKQTQSHILFENVKLLSLQ